MNSREKIIHEAIDGAIRARAAQAASIYVEPKFAASYSCSAPGCVRPALSLGLCNAHYIRARKGMSMSAPIRARKRDDRCAQCGVETGAKGGWGLCQAHYRAARYSTIKDALIAVMGGRCARCAGVFPRRVFDFHHEGADKSEHPSAMLVNQSAAAIAREMSRCVLLCANCHRLEHADDFRGGD